MVSLAIPKEDLETMSYTDLNTQKKFLTNKEEQNPDIKLVNEQNFKKKWKINVRRPVASAIPGISLNKPPFMV